MRLHHLIPLALMILLFFSCKKDKNIITLEAQTFEVLESITDAEKIGKIVATSSEGTPLTFKLIENSDDLFIVDSDGSFGLATGKRFNFNTTASHQIIVEATDGTKSVSATININLASVILAFEAQTFDVLETIAPGEEIGKIVATSSSGSPLTFRLVEDPDDLFAIDPHGGATGKRQLNFKTAASHQIVVEVTDGFKTVSNTITINVIDVVDPFITTWKTDNNGLSDDNQVTISTRSGQTYNYTVDWGDGSKDSLVTANITHTYATSGIYMVSISGTFPHTVTYTGGDQAKLLTIEQWGEIQWKNMADAFSFCPNLKINATDAPDLSQVTSTSRMFKGATSMNSDLNHWDLSNVKNMALMFQNATAFNQDLNGWDVSRASDLIGMFTGATAFNGDITNWDVSNVKRMDLMFNNAQSFDQNLNQWDISNVTHMGDMFNNSGLTMVNYDALLITWSKLNVKSNVSLGVGNTKFSGNGAAPRALLIDTYNWTIIDGGSDR